MRDVSVLCGTEASLLIYEIVRRLRGFRSRCMARLLDSFVFSMKHTGRSR